MVDAQSPEQHPDVLEVLFDLDLFLGADVGALRCAVRRLVGRARGQIKGQRAA